MKKTIVDSWQIQDATEDVLRKEMESEGWVWESSRRYTITLPDGISCNPLSFTPIELPVVVDEEMMTREAWESMPETDPTRYQRIKQDMIKSSRFYEPPKEEKPDSFDSDWD